MQRGERLRAGGAGARGVEGEAGKEGRRQTGRHPSHSHSLMHFLTSKVLTVSCTGHCALAGDRAINKADTQVLTLIGEVTHLELSLVEGESVLECEPRSRSQAARAPLASTSGSTAKTPSVKGHGLRIPGPESE